MNKKEKFSFYIPEEKAVVTVRLKSGQSQQEAKEEFLNKLKISRKGLNPFVR